MAGIDLKDRISAYIYNVEQFLNSVKEEELSREASFIVSLARDYLNDAKYYLEKGDYITSLSCIAYAEGLLDALRHQGHIKTADWKPLSEALKRPLVLVAGSFEFLHPGHLALLKRAWELGRVHVVVSRDRNFEKFKGRKPVLSENDRLEVVRSVKYVSSASLGDEEDFLKPIIDLKPDIILLGPDQWIEPSELKELLEKRGLVNVKILKYEKREGLWSSTSVYSELKKQLCINHD